MPKTHNVAIARSGVQTYLRSELPGLGITSIPRELNHLNVFGVYRPSWVIEKHKKDFTNKPVAVGHENWLTGLDDNRAIGKTLDKHDVKMHGKELEIQGQVQVNDEAYDIKDQPVSPGYKGIFTWAPGVTAEGVEFQIMMKEITEVNHLAFVPKGRGGDHIKVLDGGVNVPNKRKILSGLLRYAKKVAHGVGDADMGSFRNTINDVLENRTRWTPEEMEEHCQTLMVLTNDLPDSEEKDKLLRFISDLPLVAGEDDETAKQVGEAIAALYEQLDSDAMSDVVSQGGPAVPEPVEADKPAAPVAEGAPVATEVANDPVAAKDEALAPKGGDSDYVLKEIFMLLKKHFEGAAQPAADEAPDVPAPAHKEPDGDEGAPMPPKVEDAAPPAKEEPPKKDEYVGDAAMPSYSQKLETHAKVNSLDNLFETMKGGHAK